MGGKTWVKITVPCGSEATDAVAAFLGQATGRGVLLEEEGAAARVIAYAEPETAQELCGALARFTRNLLEAGTSIGEGNVSLSEVPEEDWMAVFRSQHGRVAVSDRLAVRPKWVEPAFGREVVIDPGLAFGTGSHASTRLCLVLLDEAIGTRPPSRMLDLGTGTGVLAIAAVFLGVSQATALDIDPVAAQAARENAEDNGVADRVRVVCGGIGYIAEPFPLVAANLSTFVLVEEAKTIAPLIANSGLLIVSGIAAGEMDGVLTAFAQHGFVPDRRLAENGWEAARLIKYKEGPDGA